MTRRISKSGFNARALEIFRRIESTGEPVVVTDRGEPTLVVSKYAGREKAAQYAGREMAARNRLKGSVLRYDDPVEPVASIDSGSIR